MSQEPPAPQDIVIIGASGDLSRRKPLPAVYNLAVAGLLMVRQFLQKHSYLRRAQAA